MPCTVYKAKKAEKVCRPLLHSKQTLCMYRRKSVEAMDKEEVNCIVKEAAKH